LILEEKLLITEAILLHRQFSLALSLNVAQKTLAWLSFEDIYHGFSCLYLKPLMLEL
jgi:hypothetical protein